MEASMQVLKQTGVLSESTTKVHIHTNRAALHHTLIKLILCNCTISVANNLYLKKMFMLQTKKHTLTVSYQNKQNLITTLLKVISSLRSTYFHLGRKLQKHKGLS